MTTWPNGRALTQQAGLSGRYAATGANVGLPFTDRTMSRLSARETWTKDAIPTGYGWDGVLAKSDGFLGATSSAGHGKATVTGAVRATGRAIGSVLGGASSSAPARRGYVIGGGVDGSAVAQLNAFANGALGAFLSIGSRPSADDAAEATVGKKIVGLGLSVGESLALIVRLLRNKQITDPVTGEIRVYSDDDVSVLLAADLWKDADGSVPYNGSGADRRDRLT